MFDKLKTRKGRMENRVKTEMDSDSPNVDKLLTIINDYQSDNEDTIEKLKKTKKVELSRINGALKQTINAHGPITKELIGSAGKRIYGALMLNPNQAYKEKFSIKSIFTGIVVGAIIASALFLIF